ncbi:MAG: 3,4-dehydroadipyl-CoA semialdehyde dehydrogenase [Deltaproteobacteria bacterium]|nr:3,4-dehydroadipyl-CoA semialdehyde dehydrogenase [Deltaproteobacteria bacterium]
MQQLKSFLCGRWQSGADPQTVLHDATTGAAIAQTSSRGLDLGAALRHGRAVGGPALRQLSFAQRGEILGQLASVLVTHRDHLLDLSGRNMGTTRGDGKFDIDGASGTLAYYAKLGQTLGDRTWLADGEQVQFSRSKRFVGQHIWSPRRGIAVHINAFNFPAWNLCEKLACALLAGMPVLAKPGTATAIVSVRIVELWQEAGLLPDGALQLLVGSAGDLLDHLGPQDCVVFTGSGSTGQQIRSHPQVLRYNVPVNVEADSINATVLGPDIAPGSDVWTMFLAEVVREITQKAGQKCTAIRRVLVPSAVADEVQAELVARLQDARVGDPAVQGTAVGPVAGPAQKRDVVAGLQNLALHAQLVWQAADVPADGCFVATSLFRTDAGAAAEYVHDHEVFGPAATLLPYAGSADEAVDIVARAGGCLATSVFSDDAAWAGHVVLGVAPYTGRVYWGSSKVFDQGTGHGAVMPALVHGGPGKAGGGEELGGERGLRFYWQRTAIQGDTQLLRGLVG